MLNYYHLFLCNIYTLVNFYGFEPYWFDLGSKKFLNGTRIDFKNFDTEDKFLLKHKEKKSSMGADILERGTFCPFFFFEEEGKNKLYLGKHRLYSLMLHKKESNINFGREFLFLKSPINPIGLELKETIQVPPLPSSFKFYDFDCKGKDYEVKPDSLQEVYRIVLFTGEVLSNWLFENNIQPSFIINNKVAFEKFIGGEFELEIKMGAE